jgi:hypothetical protein
LAQVDGIDVAEWVGESLGSAGDFNADGVNDLLVTGLSASVGGRVAVIFGPFTESLVITQANVQLTGEAGFHNAGEQAQESGACDVDGDGVDDLIIGSPFGDRTNVQNSPAVSGDNAGRAYLVYGKKEGRLNLREAEEIFVGEAAYDAAGKAVTCLGDLDADGRDDFAIGAPRAGPGREGRVYGYYGRPKGTWPVGRPHGVEEADFILVGVAPYASFGAVISRVGDVNGDGREDFAVGSPDADTQGQDSGAVYLYLTGPTRRRGQTPASESDARFDGASQERAGAWVSGRGDFQGDGLTDFLIGTAPVRNAASDAPGRGYVILGRTTFSATQSVEDEFVVVGETANDGAGCSLAFLADGDGDGRSELVVGAVRGDGPEPRTGKAWLLRGRPTTPPGRLELTNAYVVATGTAERDYFGQVVSDVGDLDGDGVHDLAIGARGVTTTATTAGRVVVYSGSALGGK